MGDPLANERTKMFPSPIRGDKMRAFVREVRLIIREEKSDAKLREWATANLKHLDRELDELNRQRAEIDLAEKRIHARAERSRAILEGLDEYEAEQNSASWTARGNAAHSANNTNFTNTKAANRTTTESLDCPYRGNSPRQQMYRLLFTRIVAGGKRLTTQEGYDLCLANGIEIPSPDYVSKALSNQKEIFVAGRTKAEGWGAVSIHGKKE